MPFVHVKSLPFEGSFDAEAAVKRITRDFAQAAGIGAEHVTVTWEYFAPAHYAAGAVRAATDRDSPTIRQPRARTPGRWIRKRSRRAAAELRASGRRA